MSKRPFIAANWKMNKTVRETTDFIRALSQTARTVMDRDIIVAPPFTALYAACDAARGTSIRVAAQNLHWQDNGAYTGEISAAMLTDVGCDYVIIGHSERRRLFAESDIDINRKLAKALAVGLKPIFCIGETLEEREAGQTLTVIGRQIKEGLNKLSRGDIESLVVAYEPVWAIGTGKTASLAQAGDAHRAIRREIEVLYDADAAAALVILYGGSVNPENIGALMAEPDIDGVLVGGASLDLASFIKIIHFDKT